MSPLCDLLTESLCCFLTLRQRSCREQRRRKKKKTHQEQDGTTGASSLCSCRSCSGWELEPQGAHYPPPQSHISLMCFILLTPKWDCWCCLVCGLGNYTTRSTVTQIRSVVFVPHIGRLNFQKLSLPILFYIGSVISLWKQLPMHFLTLRMYIYVLHCAALLPQYYPRGFNLHSAHN